MSKSLGFFAFLGILVIATVISYEVGRSGNEKRIYQQDLSNRLVTVEISVKILELLRKGEYARATFGLETAMLGDLPALVDDEKEVGRSKEIERAIKLVSDYCSTYRVFDQNTNLPSHRVAKAIIELHSK
jgi:hypothetical protein